MSVKSIFNHHVFRPRLEDEQCDVCGKDFSGHDVERICLRGSGRHYAFLTLNRGTTLAEWGNLGNLTTVELVGVVTPDGLEIFLASEQLTSSGARIFHYDLTLQLPSDRYKDLTGVYDDVYHLLWPASEPEAVQWAVKVGTGKNESSPPRETKRDVADYLKLRLRLQRERRLALDKNI